MSRRLLNSKHPLNFPNSSSARVSPRRALLVVSLFPLLATAATAKAPGNPKLAVLDPIILDAIHDHQIPGAVLLVGHNGQVVYRKAFGNRALEPRREPMTVDTIFDLASLTKVVATTTAVMQLVQKGEVRLNDPVAKYIPEFAQNGKEDITVRNLLTHYSGLRGDFDLDPPWQGREAGFRLAFAENPVYPPGSRFIYSDTNFITLGALVEHVTGTTLDEYCARKIFAPLQMTHTRFLPPAAWRPKIAPTEYDEQGKMLRGVVHDPRARRMGGVAGHAGLFSTADDLSKFARALLQRQPDPGRGDGREDDHAAAAAHRPGPARLRLGHRFAIFQQSRRTSSRGIVRPHRIHRHIDLDRSHHPDLHHPADQCRPSPRAGKRGRAALQDRDRRGRGPSAHRQRERRTALEKHHRIQRGPDRGPPHRHPQRSGADRNRRARGPQLRFHPRRRLAKRKSDC